MSIFRNLFGRRDEPPKVPPPRPPAPQPISFDGVRWLEADESPFGIRVLDCRPFSRSMISTTKDPGIANRFVQLRASDGREHVGKRPKDAIEAACALAYPAPDGTRDGPRFKADQMEDKWDVYLYEGVLYFARSWGGELIFTATTELRDGQLHLTSVAANPNPADGNPEIAVRVVDYLVKSHVLGREVPHPLPPSLNPDPQAIAVFSFGSYGRRASFATFEDTLGI